MTVYFCVYLLIALSSLLGRILYKDKNGSKMFLSAVCFGIIALLISLRHPSMGVNLGYGKDYGYINSFEKISQKPWDAILLGQPFLNYEWGYVLLNKIVATFWFNEQFFLAVCAVLSIAPIFYLVKKKSDSPVMSAFIYIGLPVFHMLYSGLRQDLGIGICALSVVFISDKKPIKFIITVLVATLFHKTAIIFLIAYPIFRLRTNIVVRFLSLFVIFAVYLLRYELFYVLSSILKPEAIPDDNSSFMLFLVFCVVYIFLFVYEKEDNSGFINLFFLACCCQAFGGVYNTAMRVGYYFMIPLIIALPKTLTGILDKNTRSLFEIIVIGAFIAFGLYSIYHSSWSMANPYYWFWQ